jgi:hypothetical protein
MQEHSHSSIPGAGPSSPSRRDCIRLAGAALAAATMPAVRAQGRNGSVTQTGADPSGANDSTDAFNKAIAQFDVVDVPAGTFLIGDVELRAGVTLRGQGDGTVLRHKPGARHALHCDSGAPDAFLRNIVLQGFQVRGASDTAGFSEFLHLISLNGVADARVERVNFTAFQGDGLYIGSSDKGHTERHNRNVVVTACVFDGANGENRNGISVVDCDGLLVEKCLFRKVSRANMPGAIDLEPNADAFHVVRNIRILNNRFMDIGGNVGVVCMHIPSLLTSMPSNIEIANNTIEGKTGIAFSFTQAAPPPAGSPLQNIVVHDNKIQGQSQRPFELRGMNGVEFRNNNFQSPAQSAIIGYKDPQTLTRETTIVGNTFFHCGKDGGIGFSVFRVSGLNILQNEFNDCGNGQGTSYIFDFNAGESERVVVKGNRFLSPTGKTKFIAQKEAGHRFNASTNVFSADNQIAPGLRNNLEAAQR